MTFTNTTDLRLPFFVYGTLRPDQGNDRIWHNVAEPVGDGVVFVQGFRLVGRGFPYAVPTDPATVTIGCLVVPHPDWYWEVMGRMDQLEGVGSHYNRIVVPVWTSPTDTLPIAAWMYTPALHRDFDSLPSVPGNDWSNAYGVDA